MISVWKGLSLLAVSELGGTVRRNVAVFIVYGVSAVIGLIGVLFALLASQAWLVNHMSIIAANLLVAGTLLGFAILVALIGFFQSRQRQKPSPLASTALIAAPYAARLVGGKLNLGTLAVLGVVATGAIIGRQLGRD